MVPPECLNGDVFLHESMNDRFEFYQQYVKGVVVDEKSKNSNILSLFFELDLIKLFIHICQYLDLKTKLK